MAYSTPTTRSDGYVIDAAEWNKNTVDNPIALRTGALAIASQALGDVVIASTSTQLSRTAAGAAKTALISNGAGVAPSFQSVTVTGQANGDVIIANSTTGLTVVAPGTAGYVLRSAGAATPPTFAAPYLELLKANSGTTTSTSAENVDTYAMASTLTAKDTLLVKLTWEAVTQASTSIALYNATDGVTMVDINDQAGAGNFLLDREAIWDINARQLQSGATSVMTMSRGHNDNNASYATGARSAFTTNWTGAWTLALRHGGVVAGGTARWSWAVYAVRGQ